MDKPHSIRHIEALGFFKDSVKSLTPKEFSEKIVHFFCDLFWLEIGVLMTTSVAPTPLHLDLFLFPDPPCTPMKYPKLYLKEKEVRLDGNLIQKAVFYFLRAPVHIGTYGRGEESLSLDPSDSLWSNDYFHGKQKKYLDFLHTWSAHLSTGCEDFFDWLKQALAQPLSWGMQVRVNYLRHRVKVSLLPFVNIEKLGAILQPLEERAKTMEDFLLHLISLAAIVNECNKWLREEEVYEHEKHWPREIVGPDYLRKYDGLFAEECIRMFDSLLVTSMSPLRLAWMEGVARGTLWRQSKVAPSWPGAGAGARAPRLALMNGSASASDTSRKQGRDGDSGGDGRDRKPGGRKKPQRHHRARSKCSIM
jgi:hypothetical protein